MVATELSDGVANLRLVLIMLLIITGVLGEQSCSRDERTEVSVNSYWY